MPTIALRPSARALRLAVAKTQRCRRGPISTGQWEAGYQVLYRPMTSEWSFSPSWCCLLVVPSDEEVE